MSLKFINNASVSEDKILLLVSTEQSSIQWQGSIASSGEKKDTGIVLEITPTEEKFSVKRLFPDGNDTVLTYTYEDWKYDNHSDITDAFENKSTYINHDNLFMNVMVCYKMEGMLGKKYQTYHCDAGIPGNLEALDEVIETGEYPEELREIADNEVAEYLTATDNREDEYHFIIVKNLTDNTYSTFLHTLVHMKLDPDDMEVTKDEYNQIVSTGIQIQKLSENYY